MSHRRTYIDRTDAVVQRRLREAAVDDICCQINDVIQKHHLTPAQARRDGVGAAIVLGSRPVRANNAERARKSRYIWTQEVGLGSQTSEE